MSSYVPDPLAEAQAKIEELEGQVSTLKVTLKHADALTEHFKQKLELQEKITQNVVRTYQQNRDRQFDQIVAQRKELEALRSQLGVLVTMVRCYDEEYMACFECGYQGHCGQWQGELYTKLRELQGKEAA